MTQPLQNGVGTLRMMLGFISQRLHRFQLFVQVRDRLLPVVERFVELIRPFRGTTKLMLGILPLRSVRHA